MKQFFKFMFASCLGTFLSLALILFVFIAIISSVAKFSKKDSVSIKSNTILHLTFNEQIDERQSDKPFDNFDFDALEIINKPSLDVIITNIEKAKNDPNISGIYLDIDILMAGYAMIDEIRQALIDFKTSGKFIVSYQDFQTQGAYYLSSVADKVFLNPVGALEFKGLNASSAFFKGTLDKLEVEAQVIRQGRYKSAVEPFSEKEMSPENRYQITELLDAFWEDYIKNLSISRNIKPATLNNIADNFFIQTPENALEYGLVDSLIYKDQLMSYLQNKLGIDEDDEIKTIKLGKYIRVADINKKTVDRNSKVAIVYAEGSIVTGKGGEGQVGSTTISKAIRKARLDSNVKAVVLRINSPGGSALASEIIWREAYLTNEVKPVVVSMSNLAASGGYYIASPARYIYADAKTITGSIGVYGILPNAQKFFNNKLGVTFDNVKTNDHADLGTITRPLSEFERKVFENSTAFIYKTFLNRVANGRKMSVEEVHKIGEGRVWSGVDAVKIGLVDEIGGIKKAIAKAVEFAGIDDDYRIVKLPKKQDPFSQIMKDLKMGISSSFFKNELGESYKYYNQLKEAATEKGVQAKMPFYLEIR